MDGSFGKRAERVRHQPLQERDLLVRLGEVITNLETTVIRDIEYHDFDNALMRNKVWTHIQYGGVDARLVRRIGAIYDDNRRTLRPVEMF